MMDNEQVLLRRFAQSRDALAFRELVEGHKNMVFAACRRVLGNQADAEDAAQVCFLKLAEAAGRLKAPISGWLHTVAVRSSIDILRSETARKARERSVSRRDVVTTEARWVDVEADVDAALESLPKRLRQPIVLYFLEGRTQEQVADALGVTRRTVGTRLNRGLELLRRRLKRAGIVAPAAALAAMLTANAAEAAPVTLTATLGKMALGKVGSGAGAALQTLVMTAVVLVAVITIGGVGLGLARMKRPAPVHMQAAISASGPVKVVVPVLLTVKAAMDAEITLPSGGGMGWRELAKLIHKQLGVYVSHPYGFYTGSRFLDFVPFKPGRCKLRDVVAMVMAPGQLTFEAHADGKIVALYFWHKPDAPLLAETLKLARSDDALERCTGARWLQEVRGRVALVQLLTMLQDENARVRYFAGCAIGRGWGGGVERNPLSFVAPKGTVAAVARGVDDDEWWLTQLIMEGLARRLRAPEVFLPIFRRRWEHAAQVDPGVLARVPAGVFRLPGGREGLDAEADLFALLDELPDPNSRWAMQALVWLDTDAAIARINKQIDAALKNGEQWRIGGSLMWRLLRSDNPVAARGLAQIFNYFNAERLALEALAANPGGRDEAEMRAHPHSLLNVSGWALMALKQLAKFDTPEARAACLAYFKAAKDHPERRGMARLMVWRQPDVRDLLYAELAQGGGATLRAAELLRSTNDQRLVPLLIQTVGMSDRRLRAEGMSDKDRQWAIAALGEIGGPEAEKQLIELAQSEAANRRNALRALGGMKITSPAACRVLRTAALDADADIRNTARFGLNRKLQVGDLTALVGSAQMAHPEDDPRMYSQGDWDMWAGVARIGGARAARELADATAKGNPLAAVALIHARDTHCLQVVRDVFAGNDAKMKRMLMDAVLPARPGVFANQHVSGPGAYYAVRALLDEFPRVDAKRKVVYVASLGWTRDPRAIDAVGKLLVDLDEPVAVRRAAAVAVQAAPGPGGTRDSVRTNSDPAAVEPTRHAYENDPDDSVRKEARLSLIGWRLIPRDQAKAPLPPRKGVRPAPAPEP